MLRRQILRCTGAALTGLSFAARTGAEAASAAAAAGSGAASGARFGPLSPEFAPPPTLAPIRARPDRLIDISVCTRPFRAQGPRLESERLHGKIVVHHYGHGGSGWSLSWGSAKAALPMILAPRQRQIAVVGCGAIGLTTARVAQRAGLRVRIYCKDMPPQVRSSLATGVWSPDSRVCTSEFATPEFMARWEAMARTSFKVYQTLLGLPGDPVEWRDGFFLSDVPFDQEIEEPDRGEPEYPELENLRVTCAHVPSRLTLASTRSVSATFAASLNCSSISRATSACCWRNFCARAASSCNASSGIRASSGRCAST